MITITFTPETYAQASAVANAMLQYMAASEVQAMGEQTKLDLRVVEADLQAEQAEQQARDLAAAETNRADDAARTALQAKRTRAKKEAAAEPVEKPAATSEEPASPAPTPSSSAAAAPAAKGPTLVDVRAKLAALSQAGKADAVKALLKKFGATKLTDVAEENYGLLLDDAEAL